jgi:WD40 repeat protein
MSCVGRLVAAILLVALGSLPGPAADQGRAIDLHPQVPVARLRLGEGAFPGGDGHAALAPDGNTLILGTGNVTLVFDLARGRGRQPRQLFLSDAGPGGDALAFATDGQTVAGLTPQGQDASVRVWDLATGKQLREIDNDEPFLSLAFSPDGTLLALGAQGRVEVWDAVSGDEVRVLHGLENHTFDLLAFSPDGKTLAAAEAEASVVRLWEVASGKERDTIRLVMNRPEAAGPRPVPARAVPVPVVPADAGLTALALAPDGRTLALGGADQAIRLWDLAAGRELPPLVGHQGPVRALTFTPDGRRLVSFDPTGVRLTWDARRLRRHADAPLVRLDADDFAGLWDDLGEGDAFRVYRAVRHLAADPGRALPLLRGHLKAVPVGDPERIKSLVADLQSPSGAQRRKAMAELRRHGEAAYAALNALGDEQKQHRAVQIVLARLEAQRDSADRMRELRAVAALEAMGAPEARRLLESLAKGAEGAPLTAEAKGALERLGRKRTARAAAASPEALWADLGDGDARKAYRAVLELSDDPAGAAALLRGKLRPVPAVGAKQVEALIADLNSDDYATRQKATAGLEALADLAVPALKKALAAGPSAEVRKRVGALLERVEGQAVPPEQLRALRGIEALEHAGTAEARAVLEGLARGAPSARLTREARASLLRLAKRP